MGTVDAMYATRAEQIEDSSVVSGLINPTTRHLILTKADGTTIDAGEVKPNSPVSATVNSSGHLIFTMTDGTTQDAGAVVVSADVQIFSASGTWTKPSGAKLVEVFVLGGGGGGAGGMAMAQTSPANRTAFGGQGGASAGYSFGKIRASDLGATVAVTVGAGGTAGSATSVTTGSSTGGNGGAGGNSSFGAYLVGRGGFAGAAGSGQTTQGLPDGREPGGQGGTWDSNQGIFDGTGIDPTSSRNLFGPGGAGGVLYYMGADNTDVEGNYGWVAGQNGGKTRNNPQISAGAGGYGTNTGGGVPGGAGTAPPLWEGGTGGGGGGPSFKVGAGNVNGGAGGAGAPGCGGGGGAGAMKAITGSTVSAGAGGAGGAGRVIVITHF